MMQKFYEAIYDRGEIEWLGDAPSCEYALVMLVTGDEDELAEFRKVITALKLPDDVNVFFSAACHVARAFDNFG